MNNPNEGGSSMSGGSSSSILSDKVARALQVRTDVPAVKAALEALSGLSEDMDSRTVRFAMEQDALKQALLLQEGLQEIVDAVSQLRKECSQIANIAHLVRETIETSAVTAVSAKQSGKGENKENTNDQDAEAQLAETLHEAFMKRNTAKNRLEAVNAFMERFNLSETDNQLLDEYNFENENYLQFLKALERVRRIRFALSRTDGLGEMSTLGLMESLAQKQERAYERLYQFLQSHLSSNMESGGSDGYEMDDEEENEFWHSEIGKHSLYVLSHVPAFHSHILELLASSRRSKTTRRFLIALTTGTPDGPPLEMKAHDAVAYVGDMLAFAFKTFSVEADLAKGLLDYQPEDDEREEEKQEGDTTEDAQLDQNVDIHVSDELSLHDTRITASEILSIAMSGLTRPLKSRILQVVSTSTRRTRTEDDNGDKDGVEDEEVDELEEECALTRTRLGQLYEICGLLLFYSSTLSKSVERLNAKLSESRGGQSDYTLSATNPLVESLMQCLTESSRGFEATIRVYTAMLDQWSVMTGDSEASLVHSLLVLLAEVRKNSPGFASDVDCPESCREILSIDWITETSIMSCACPSLDDVIYLKLALGASKACGMDVVMAEKVDKYIEEKESTLIDQVVEMESTQVLDLCGMLGVAQAWKRYSEVQDNAIVMASFPGLDTEQVSMALKEFYASLYSPPLPSLETIKDANIRKQARSRIAETVCKLYADLYEAVMMSGSGYVDTSFLGHSPDQVNTLFSV